MTKTENGTSYVLDASALLCLVFREAGADRVEERLTGALVSAANYHEVFSKLSDRGVAPKDVREILANLDIDVIAVDRHQADLGGVLRSSTRHLGLSLGERSCLALAQARNAVVVTTHQAWEALDIGVRVEVVR